MTDGEGNAAPARETMEDVDHESPDGASADRVFERGPDEDGV